MPTERISGPFGGRQRAGQKCLKTARESRRRRLMIEQSISQLYIYLNM